MLHVVLVILLLLAGEWWVVSQSPTGGEVDLDLCRRQFPGAFCHEKVAMAGGTSYPVAQFNLQSAGFSTQRNPNGSWAWGWASNENSSSRTPFESVNAAAGVWYKNASNQPPMAKRLSSDSDGIQLSTGCNQEPVWVRWRSSGEGYATARGRCSRDTAAATIAVVWLRRSPAELFVRPLSRPLSSSSSALLAPADKAMCEPFEGTPSGCQRVVTLATELLSASDFVFNESFPVGNGTEVELALVPRVRGGVDCRSVSVSTVSMSVDVEVRLLASFFTPPAVFLGGVASANLLLFGLPSSSVGSPQGGVVVVCPYGAVRCVRNDTVRFAPIDERRLRNVTAVDAAAPHHLIPLYDVSADFSTVANPSGPWEYGWSEPEEYNDVILLNDSAAPSSALVSVRTGDVMHRHTAGVPTTDGLMGWWSSVFPVGTDIFTKPWVERVESLLAWSDRFTVREVKAVIMSPSKGLRWSRVRWRTPASLSGNGIATRRLLPARLKASLQPVNIARDTLCMVVFNRTRTIVKAKCGEVPPIDLTFNVMAGVTVIDFIVGPAPDGTWEKAHVQINATITVDADTDQAAFECPFGAPRCRDGTPEETGGNPKATLLREGASDDPPPSVLQYDIANDFGIAVNAGAPYSQNAWTYGWSKALDITAPLNLFPHVKWTNFLGWWRSDNLATLQDFESVAQLAKAPMVTLATGRVKLSIRYPLVEMNLDRDRAQYGVSPRQVSLYAGASSSAEWSARVRWTSPCRGVARMQARFDAGEAPSCLTMIVVNTTVAFIALDVTSPDPTLFISYAFNVDVGTTVDFTVSQTLDDRERLVTGSHTPLLAAFDVVPHAPWLPECPFAAPDCRMSAFPTLTERVDEETTWWVVLLQRNATPSPRASSTRQRRGRKSDVPAFTDANKYVVGIYDLEKDFSLVSNPNGQWSYGWSMTEKPGRRGPFRELALRRQTIFPGWWRDPLHPTDDLYYPCVEKNVGVNTVYAIPSGKISMNAGNADRSRSMVRWTSPCQLSHSTGSPRRRCIARVFGSFGPGGSPGQHCELSINGVTMLLATCERSTSFNFLFDATRDPRKTATTGSVEFAVDSSSRNVGSNTPVSIAVEVVSVATGWLPCPFEAVRCGVGSIGALVPLSTLHQLRGSGGDGSGGGLVFSAPSVGLLGNLTEFTRLGINAPPSASGDTAALLGILVGEDWTAALAAVGAAVTTGEAEAALEAARKSSSIATAAPRSSVLAAAIFSANADFSTNANPNGCWQYCKATLRQFMQECALLPFVAGAQTEGWFANDPAKGLTSGWVEKSVHDVPIYGIQPGAVVMVAPVDDRNTFTKVRWTSPGFGTARIKGRFQGEDSNSQKTVFLSAGETWRVSTAVTDTPTFDFLLNVAPEDIIDFVVGAEAYGNSGASSHVSIDAVIAVSEEVPPLEPHPFSARQSYFGAALFDAVGDFVVRDDHGVAPASPRQSEVAKLRPWQTNPGRELPGTDSPPGLQITADWSAWLLSAVRLSNPWTYGTVADAALLAQTQAADNASSSKEYFSDSTPMFRMFNASGNELWFGDYIGYNVNLNSSSGHGAATSIDKSVLIRNWVNGFRPDLLRLQCGCGLSPVVRWASPGRGVLRVHASFLEATEPATAPVIGVVGVASSSDRSDRNATTAAGVYKSWLPPPRRWLTGKRSAAGAPWVVDLLYYVDAGDTLELAVVPLPEPLRCSRLFASLHASLRLFPLRPSTGTEGAASDHFRCPLSRPWRTYIDLAAAGGPASRVFGDCRRYRAAEDFSFVSASEAPWTYGTYFPTTVATTGDIEPYDRRFVEPSPGIHGGGGGNATAADVTMGWSNATSFVARYVGHSPRARDGVEPGSMSIGYCGEPPFSSTSSAGVTAFPAVRWFGPAPRSGQRRKRVQLMGNVTGRIQSGTQGHDVRPRILFLTPLDGGPPWIAREAIGFGGASARFDLTSVVSNATAVLFSMSVSPSSGSALGGEAPPAAAATPTCFNLTWHITIVVTSVPFTATPTRTTHFTRSATSSLRAASETGHRQGRTLTRPVITTDAESSGARVTRSVALTAFSTERSTTFTTAPMGATESLVVTESLTMARTQNTTRVTTADLTVQTVRTASYGDDAADPISSVAESAAFRSTAMTASSLAGFGGGAPGDSMQLARLSSVSSVAQSCLSSDSGPITDQARNGTSSSRLMQVNTPVSVLSFPDVLVPGWSFRPEPIASGEATASITDDDVAAINLRRAEAGKASAVVVSNVAGVAILSIVIILVRLLWTFRKEEPPADSSRDIGASVLSVGAPSVILGLVAVTLRGTVASVAYLAIRIARSDVGRTESVFVATLITGAAAVVGGVGLWIWRMRLLHADIKSGQIRYEPFLVVSADRKKQTVPADPPLLSAPLRGGSGDASPPVVRDRGASIPCDGRGVEATPPTALQRWLMVGGADWFEATAKSSAHSNRLTSDGRLLRRFRPWGDVTSDLTVSPWFTLIGLYTGVIEAMGTLISAAVEGGIDALSCTASLAMVCGVPLALALWSVGVRPLRVQMRNVIVALSNIGTTGVALVLVVTLGTRHSGGRGRDAPSPALTWTFAVCMWAVSLCPFAGLAITVSHFLFRRFPARKKLLPQRTMSPQASKESSHADDSGKSAPLLRVAPDLPTDDVTAVSLRPAAAVNPLSRRNGSLPV